MGAALYELRRDCLASPRPEGPGVQAKIPDAIRWDPINPGSLAQARARLTMANSGLDRHDQSGPRPQHA